MDFRQTCLKVLGAQCWSNRLAFCVLVFRPPSNIITRPLSADITTCRYPVACCQLDLLPKQLPQLTMTPAPPPFDHPPTAASYHSIRPSPVHPSAPAYSSYHLLLPSHGRSRRVHRLGSPPVPFQLMLCEILTFSVLPCISHSHRPCRLISELKRGLLLSANFLSRVHFVAPLANAGYIQ